MKTPQRPNGTAAGKAFAACVILLLLPAVCAARAQRRKPAPSPAQSPPRAASVPVKSPVSLKELLGSLGDGGPKTRGLVREVEARGVDFEMTTDAETALRDAGASAALVEAARKNYRGPVDRSEFQAMVYLSVLRPPRFTNAEIVENVERRGVNFRLTPDDEARLAEAGARPEVIAAARSNYRPARQEPPRATLPMPVVIQVDSSLLKDDPAKLPYVAPTPSYGGMGTGGGMGMGPGTGGGVGVGNGTGYGPGRGYNTGGGDGGGSGGEVDYTRTFKPGEVTRKAVLTAKPEPSFTEEARKNNVTGVVRLRAVLSASGSVQGISVVKGLPDGLTEKAIAAARGIRFTPAQKDGHTVSQYVTLEYNFNIESYYNENEVTKRAVIVEKPAAEYTAEARRNRASGKVVLKVVLLSYGSVSVISVEQSMPYGLTEKAVEAARRIRFTPAELNGSVVTQLATVEYDFAP
jgi:TonB family protein